MIEHKWELKEYGNINEKKGILNLRKKVFKDEDEDKENENFWDWEFEENYAGPAKIFLAVDGEKVVGHYAVCPSIIKVAEKQKSGSIVVDVMTHPDYRFQGMFTEIGRFALDRSGVSGIDFSYGFPIRKSVLPGHLKIGWRVAFPLPVYVYPISFSKIIDKFIHCKPLAAVLGFIPEIIYHVCNSLSCLHKKRLVLRENFKFEESKELYQFIEVTKNQHKVMQVRDFAFLKWRYNDNQYRKYHIISAFEANGTQLGYIVLRQSDIFGLNCITIIDIQALSFRSEVINSLIDSTLAYAESKGAALLGFMTNQNLYKKKLVSKGFLKSPYIFKFILHENRYLDYMKELLLDENWLLTWADTDDL